MLFSVNSEEKSPPINPRPGDPVQNQWVAGRRMIAP